MAGTRLTIVQYAGDFAEAAKRFAAGEDETYRGQKYTVGFVEGLAGSLDAVTTIAALTEEPYDVMLPSGARAIGAGCKGRIDFKRLLELIEATEPDMLIVRSPLRPVLGWAIRNKVRTFALLADSFDQRSLKGWVKFAILRRQLNNPVVDLVANHGLMSTRQLADGGIKTEKLMAWDFPPFNTPEESPVKTRPGEAPRAVYVGVLSEPKGAFDFVEAIGRLAREGMVVRADLVGRGETERIAEQIARLDLGGQVRLRGLVPNRDIIPLMREADLVVVPSHRSYPEGLPLTIYEALCARTPLVLSDHPMFVQNLRDDVDAAFFEAGDAQALATRIKTVLEDADGYARLSRNAHEAWRRIQVPGVWDKIISAWIANDPASKVWLSANAMASQAAA